MTKLFKPVVINGDIADVRDAAVYAKKDVDLDFGLAAIVTHDAFLKSLARTGTRDFNIENLFERNLRPLIDAPASSYDEALEIAENSDKHSVAVTSVETATNDKKSTVNLHLIINKEFGRSLIVGDTPPRGVKKAFAKAGIRYVDRTAPDALAQIRAGLADVVGKKQKAVAMAFLYRSDLEDTTRIDRDFAAVLADRSISMSYPKYIVKR